MKNQKQSKNARSVQPARSQQKDPRWSFELGATSWGPFSTKGAKINSRSIGSNGMVGLGNRAMNIQRPMPRLVQTKNENGNVVDMLTGTDFLITLQSSSSGFSPGDVILSQDISPGAFGATRLAQFSALYQRYRFRKVQFLYEPVANATQSGQLLGYADFDVDNRLSMDSPDNLNIAAAHQGQKPVQIWEPMAFDMGQTLKFTDLFTEAGASETSDPRLTIQGLFYVLAASAIESNIPLGNIYVDYEVEFSIPFLSANSALLQRDSYWVGSGTMDGAAAAQVVFAVGTHKTAGPVQADYSVPGVTIQWSGLLPGDQILVEASCSDSITSGTNGSGSWAFTTTGISAKVESRNTFFTSTANVISTVVSLVLTADPIGSLATLTWTNTSAFPLTVAPGNLSWALVPFASVSAKPTKAVVRRLPALERREREAADREVLLRKEIDSLRAEFLRMKQFVSPECPKTSLVAGQSPHLSSQTQDQVLGAEGNRRDLRAAGVDHPTVHENIEVTRIRSEARDGFRYL